jgi:hypothetical protein
VIAMGMNVAEKMSVLIQNVDESIVYCQNITLAVCSYAKWSIILVIGGMSRISESEFSRLIDHHHCSYTFVSYTDIPILILTYVFTHILAI